MNDKNCIFHYFVEEKMSHFRAEVKDSRSCYNLKRQMEKTCRYYFKEFVPAINSKKVE